MINTTDFQELEITLPGEWVRKDKGDIYIFTAEKMTLNDERLFRDLIVRHADGQQETLRYALTIEDDYCGILVGEDEFIIRRLVKHSDGAVQMEWADRAGALIVFEKQQQGMGNA